MHRFSVLLVAFVVLTLATAVQAKPEGAVHAAAELIDTSGTVIGDARFVEDATGAVHVNVHVQGLAPGEHGIHIHAVGDCTLGPTPAFAAAAGHFNPSSPPRQHGAHAGDLPNLTVNKAGAGRLNAQLDQFTLSAGSYSVVGRALIIHQNEDDGETDSGPLGPGNSGPRIACGFISAQE